jgi:hypothetical protein
VYQVINKSENRASLPRYLISQSDCMFIFTRTDWLESDLLRYHKDNMHTNH